MAGSQGASTALWRAPRVWGQVPARNKNFTGREDLLDRVAASLENRDTAALHALHGMPGVGKTQIAVEYAYRRSTFYDVVWWISADQPNLIQSTLASLAPYLDLPHPTATGVKEAAEMVLDALRRGDPYPKWLVVFDNADQPEDIKDFLPSGPGHALITSRNQRWQEVVHTVSVDVFSRHESVAFLEKLVSRTIGGALADQLARELGDLPLALEQAGALLAETGMSVREYLGVLSENASQLLAEGKSPEYPVSMSAAWQISVSRLNDSQPDALEVLRCCAFFGPEPIPRDVFRRGIQPTGSALGAILADPIRLTRIIRALGRFALANVDPAARTITVHRLIQALVREDIGMEEQARFRHDVQLLLAGAAPADPTDEGRWPDFAALVPHMIPAQVHESQDPEVRAFALKMVRYLHSSGNYPSARDFAKSFITRWTADSGENHPDVLKAEWYLGDALRALGDYQASLDTVRPALERARAILGPEHETRLALAMGLGADLRARGDFAAALELDQETVELCRDNLGPRAPRTLLAQNSLALDLGLASHYRAARDLHKSTYMEQSQASSGVSKASVLASWSGLSRDLRLAGEYTEARFVSEDAYEFGRQQLGPDHPWTLRTGKEFAIALRLSPDSAVDHLALAREILDRTERFYGEDHPDALAAATALANTLRSVGGMEKIIEAHDIAVRTLKRYLEVYGEEHPYFHACGGNLALLQRLRGDAVAARSLDAKSLAGLEARLTPDHDYPLTVAVNLASDHAALGELREATDLGKATLARLRGVLGEDHPVTLGCAANLALDLRAAHAMAEADRLTADAADRFARSLGPEHPDTKAARLGERLNFDFDPPPI